jgi:hypothetical protein
MNWVKNRQRGTTRGGKRSMKALYVGETQTRTQLVQQKYMGTFP